MEEKITQRSRGLSKKGRSEFCSICFKVKVASMAELVCAECRQKTCPRCGKRDQVRTMSYITTHHTICSCEVYSATFRSRFFVLQKIINNSQGHWTYHVIDSTIMRTISLCFYRLLIFNFHKNVIVMNHTYWDTQLGHTL